MTWGSFCIKERPAVTVVEETWGSLCMKERPAVTVLEETWGSWRRDQQWEWFCCKTKRTWNLSSSQARVAWPSCGRGWRVLRNEGSVTGYHLFQKTKKCPQHKNLLNCFRQQLAVIHKTFPVAQHLCPLHFIFSACICLLLSLWYRCLSRPWKCPKPQSTFLHCLCSPIIFISNHTFDTLFLGARLLVRLPLKAELVHGLGKGCSQTYLDLIFSPL